MFRLRRGFTHIYALLVGAILFVSSVSALRGDSVLNFPRLSFEPNTLTGIAIVNPSSQDAGVTFTAYGADGKLLAGEGLKNPIQLVVKSNQQISKLTSELFGGSLSASTVGWFQATSSVEGLTGFFLFLDVPASGAFTFFDGADLPPSATSIVFNQVRVDAGRSTELNIINPGTASASLTLLLSGSDGSAVSKNVTLPAKGAARLDAASFFGVSTVSAGAYVTVVSDTEVGGFEFVKTSGGDLLGLNARSASEQLTHLYFPQMAVLSPWKTELGLVNYSSSPAIVTISAYKPDGALYGTSNLKNNPVTRALEAGGSRREDVESMFGFSGPSTLDGWIKVESTVSAINGYVSYGIPATGSVAAVASSAKGQTRAIFSHIATASGFFTGIAMLNPGTLASNVRVLAIRPDAQVLGSLDIVLQPGQRLSKLINELIPQAENQAGGLIWVKSDQPIHLTSLFGTSSVLANIPAQGAPDSYRPDAALQALKLTPSLAVVQPNSTQTFQVQGATGNLIWKVNGAVSGNADVGVISPSGVFQAPGRVPSPQVVTITAEAANQIAGASVDVLEKTSLVRGLGVVQSVAYLGSLKKLYAAELATISTAKPDAQSFAQSQNSTIYEVSPPSVKSALAAFSGENIPKIISFLASDGKEYLLAAAKTTGKIIRINPVTKQSQEVVTGLNQPAALVIDPLSGNLLVAEADKISTVARAALEIGLSPTKDSSPSRETPQRAATLFPAAGSGGITVDNCSGNIYISDSINGQIIEFVRFNGQTRTLISGLRNPGQLLALYRNGVSCPDSFQLLVIEQGANRISLVIPKERSVISWLPAPGATDLALFPKDNPLTSTEGVLLTQVTANVSEVATVVTPDLYKVQPANPPAKDPCVGRVVFTDANLEATLRAALKIDATTPITCALAKSLTSLQANERKIRDLGGIEAFTNLKTLLLRNNSISEISPLRFLTDLTVLSLSNLKNLAGANNSVSDISPLSGLTKLTALGLVGNSIGDLNALSRLTGLQSLSLDSNLIRDIRPLSALTGLTDLFLSNVSYLSGGTALVFQNKNFITDLSPLSALKQLQYLYLYGISVSDIAPLSGLTELIELGLGNEASPASADGPTCVRANSISDIRPLAGLKKLTLLELTCNSVVDLQPLSALTALTELYLGGNGSTDIRPLSGMSRLAILVLIGNGISDLSPLSGLASLSQLFLQLNSVSDIRALVANPGLGAGAKIYVQRNNLTQSNCADLKTLINRGAEVFYNPQKSGALTCP